MNKPKAKADPKTLKFVVLAAIFICAIAAGLMLVPHIGRLFSESGRDALVENIRGRGVWGVLLFVGVQILQVVLFVIPGEVVEVVGGVLYGTFGGYAACTCGSLIGSVLIYMLVRRLGYEFVSEFLADKFQKLAFLRKEENAEMCVFILYLIPGTPKDGLTYFVPFTELSLARFLLLSTVARFPSVISSTLAGASLESGRVWLSVGIFAAITVVGIIGILLDRKYIQTKNAAR